MGPSTLPGAGGHRDTGPVTEVLKRGPRGPVLTRRQTLAIGGLAMGAVAVRAAMPVPKAGASSRGKVLAAPVSATYRSRLDQPARPAIPLPPGPHLVAGGISAVAW